MKHEQWARVAEVAQDGFTRLQQALVTAGATDKQSLTILLSYAQLAAELQHITIEHTSLPGEKKFVSLN